MWANICFFQPFFKLAAFRATSVSTTMMTYFKNLVCYTRSVFIILAGRVNDAVWAYRTVDAIVRSGVQEGKNLSDCTLNLLQD